MDALDSLRYALGMSRRFSLKAAPLALTVGAALLASTPAYAAVYNYVDWTVADVAAGTASGTITLPDNSTVTVTFEAIDPDLTPGTLFGAQTSGAGTNYWSPSTPYISAQVENAPPTTDILQLAGGLNQTYKVTLSEPIKDPIMAMVSLGSPGTRCTYDFDSPFAIVSQGVGYWGGGASALKALPDDILEGYEGHGTIQFIGTFSTFSWIVPTTEAWHGFTFGIRTTERIEPTPSEGGAGGGASEGGSSYGTEGGAGPSSEGGANSGVAGANDAGGAALGGESSGGAGNGGAGNGGSSVFPQGGESAGGADDGEFSNTKQDAGCGCAVPGAPVSGGLGALLLAAVATLARARRTRRRSR